MGRAELAPQAVGLAARGLGAVDGIEPTKLFARNVQVDAINKQRLLELAGATTTLRARDEGDVRRIEQCSYPAELHLRIGAQIMLLKNIDVEKKLINDSRGKVLAIQRKEGVIDDEEYASKKQKLWREEEEALADLEGA